MSKSVILLDQNSNANDVGIMVFVPCVLFPPYRVWGGGEDDMVPQLEKSILSNNILAMLEKSF